MSFVKSLFLCLLLVISAAPALLAQAPAAGANDPVLLQTLQQELDRAMTSLGKADPAPYFISMRAMRSSAWQWPAVPLS
jgi:hypothetical protein